MGTRRVTVPGRGTVTLPALAGDYGVTEAELAAAAQDFGRQVSHRPLAVCRPGSASDVAEIVRFGRAHGVPVVARGAGHTVDGQTLARDGIVVDLSTLDGVREVGPDRVDVDAGARWSTVVGATLPRGLAPPVLTDHLALSVGGTLSVGGLGGASHHHGSQADTVRELDVVTATGELVTCSPTERPDLFDAVRGTQGRHGVIVRATLALTPAPRCARRHRLRYSDLDRYLTDQRRLVEDGRFHHVDGQARYVEGTGWQYVTEAVRGYDPPAGPDDRALLAGLAHDRGAAETGTDTWADFLGRFTAIEAHQRAIGSWELPHPRCTVLIPGRHAGAVVAATLAGLTPDLLGPGGSVLLYSIPSARIAAPNVPKARDPLTVLLGVQRTAPPGDLATLDRMRAANAALLRWVTAIGGAGYAGPVDPARTTADRARAGVPPGPA